MKNNKTLKRFLAFLLCAAMMITYMPSSVYTLAGDPAGDTATEEQQKEAAGVNETEGVSDDAENSERESVQEAEESKQEETSDLKGEQSSGQSGEDQDQDEEVDDTVKKEMLADENAQAVTKKSDDDDKEAYPEQHFNKTENGTGITIKVDAATGVFPAGSDMTIESVDMDTVISAIGQNEGAKAVKISFQDKDGKAIAPAEKGMVTVTVEAKNLEEGKTYKVFHIDGSNAAEEELGASFVTDDVVFAVVGTDKPAKASRGETRSTDTAWEVRFRNRDGEVFETREIEKAEGGTALGELPPVIEREEDNAVTDESVAVIQIISGIAGVVTAAVDSHEHGQMVALQGPLHVHRQAVLVPHDHAVVVLHGRVSIFLRVVNFPPQGVTGTARLKRSGPTGGWA